MSHNLKHQSTDTHLKIAALDVAALDVAALDVTVGH